MADCASHDAPHADEPPSPRAEDSFCLHVCTLSGKSGTVSTCSSAFVEELRVSIEALLGVPAASQQWLLDHSEVALQKASTLGDTPLRPGDRITVLHSGYVPLAPLPEVFELTLTSVRSSSYCSSAFSIILKIRAHSSEGWLEFEPWRKNDHDRFVYDLKAGKLEVTTSHYMTGTTTHNDELHGNDPLRDLKQGWHTWQKRVTQEAERFWLGAGSEAPEQQQSRRCFDDPDLVQDRPNHNAVRGWFIAPSDELVEIDVDVPLPPCQGEKKIVRLLIDTDGQPVRAAVKGCKTGPLHQDIEEYDVCITACVHPDTPHLRRDSSK
eukprot:CAMPEP_0171083508 /NCGR_PEP_ID=MMETSP0766_2-20121228/17751_1 /TAXON_ID=439317 /ORGANISM="Gambierdiscus australes, Strain CAWD 149" /LENGTH=322 /DNA_ID=CAMNT_0011540941 /DNA_START=69 /DNA_END=1037 /DNA_ORIENTATION=+